MSTSKTVGELLELAIALEKMAEELYFRLFQLFVDQPAVASFWLGYAAEEAGHARWLERFLQRAQPEQLAMEADPHLLAEAYRAHRVSINQLLSKIYTLEDAYRLASELEAGETNAVCTFLIDCFEPDKKTQAFLRAQLKDHMGHLANGFPKEFNSAMLRKAVAAVKSASYE